MKEQILLQYTQENWKKNIWVWMLAAGLIVCVWASLSLTSHGFMFGEVGRSILHPAERTATILWMLRLPRVVMAVLVGAGLGVAGAIFQAILKNPLASPFTLGVGASAGLGAVIVILFGAGILGAWAVATGAFVFAIVSALFILIVASKTRTRPQTMILVGIAQMYLCSSLTSLFQYTGSMEQIAEIVFWFFGSLSKVGWREVGVSAICILLPMPYVIRAGWDLNVLSQGDETAISLGVKVASLRRRTLFAASLMTAGAICFTGVIGFVGLVAPHMTRMIMGNEQPRQLIGSAVMGGLLVAAADMVSRVLLAPQIIPIGIVTAFVGVPFFFYLLLRKPKEVW